MKPVHINHELREIRLDYKSDEELTDFEQNAVTEYIKIHNTLLALKKKHAALNGELFKLESDLPALEKDYEMAENEIKKCAPIAGYTKEEIEEMGFEGGEADINEIINAVLAFRDKFDAYHERTAAFLDEQNKWREEIDAFEEEFEKFDKEYYGPIILNWKEMEIDSVALHDDMQELYGVSDDVCTKKKNELCDTWNEFMAKFKELTNKVDAIYRRTETVQEKSNEIINSKKTYKFGLN